MTSDTMVSRALPSRSTPCVPSGPRLRSRSSPGFSLAVLGAALLLTLGCASSPEPVGSAWSSGNGMIQVDTHGRGLLFVKPDHQLGRYDDLLIEYVGFRYGDHQRWLSYREEDRISTMLASVVQGQHDGSIGITEEPGPCVLSMSFLLTDLEIHDPPPQSGSNISMVNSFGEATLIMELRDSTRDEPLARFLQRRALGGGIASGGRDAGLRRLGTVVSLAMRDMGQQLREITPTAVGGGPADTECEGRLTRVALGSH